MLVAVLALALAGGQESVPTALPETAPTPPASARAAPAAPGTTTAQSVPPGDLSTAPPLPTGQLLTVSRDEKGETFLVLDRAARVGLQADFWTYEAFTPPIMVRPGAQVVQGLAHHEVDCADNTDRTVASAGYAEDGTPIVALAASPSVPLTEGSPYALVAGKLCQDMPLPKTGDALGHAAALAAARAAEGG